MAATGAHAQAPSALAPLSAAVFDGGKALPTEWRSTEIANDDTRLKISLGGNMRDERGLPALLPSDRDSFEAKGFDVQVTRDWPALRLKAGERDIEVTPHTGFALSEAGPGAQAGATISLQDKVEDRLGRLGVRDGRSFGDKGRWYLFAATSGRSVGLNVLRGADGEMRREGWSTDATSALVSDAQVGVGWRKGAVQTSLGYMHREIKPKHGLMGMENKDDDLIAVSFSFKPR
ncbi:MAG TPA: hypothetical protein VFX95_05990 [Caulobacteraceae bacterium]|nr:hypothetical protein [Caulobacteraceae bacterium]